MAKKTVYQNWKGLGGVSHVLQKLPLDVRNEVLVHATGYAMEPVKESAKRNARRSVRTGALYASIDMVTRNYKIDATAVAIVGPTRDYFGRGGKKIGKGESRQNAEQPARYAHLIEFGHWQVTGGSLRNQHQLVLSPTGKFSKSGKELKRWKKGEVVKAGEGKKTGFVAARPFLRPAFAQNQSKMFSRFVDGCNKGIQKASDKRVREGSLVR